MSERLLRVSNIANPKRIVAFAGSKQSGKNSSANFVAGTLLYSYYYIESFQLTRDGILMNGVSRQVNNVAPKFVKIYHWADALKEFVAQTFGIPLPLLYGTDQDKDTPTQLKWENMPNVINSKSLQASVSAHLKRKGEMLSVSQRDKTLSLIYHEKGNMSIREVLQYFGSDICRVMFHNCWVQALESRILREKPQVALIADTRFDNELEAVRDWGGLCVKLNRQIKRDGHKSENGIVSFTDWSAIVSNEHTDEIRDFCQVLIKALKPTGVFNEL